MKKKADKRVDTVEDMATDEPEFSAFEKLTKKLLGVPKTELDAEREKGQ